MFVCVMDIKITTCSFETTFGHEAYHIAFSNYGESWQNSSKIPVEIFRTRGRKGQGNAGQTLVSPDSSKSKSSAKSSISTAKGLRLRDDGAILCPSGSTFRAV